MRLKRYFGLMTGRMDHVLEDGLVGQLQATREGARLAEAMTSGLVGRTEAHRRMRAIEHRGDRQREVVVDRLSSALVTPIDREDLFRLSRSLDDVLDTLRDFVRESHLYRVPGRKNLTPMLEEVLTGVDALEKAVHELMSNPSEAAMSALDARKAGGAIRRLYQYEIARVLTGEMTTDMMKERELVRRLELAGSHICDAADAIADGSMKRWH
ncbi:DUF47 domain-containing protein [Actinocorallia longicatena]|uniref:DUF47 family protein n=1 Tax=Actinocorallia longicatena TaxID=111803 RepID=A0ABP6QUC4_9ACTN